MSSYVRVGRTNTKCQHVHRTPFSTHLNNHRSFEYILLCTAGSAWFEEFPTITNTWRLRRRQPNRCHQVVRSMYIHPPPRSTKCARKYRSWTLIQAKCVELRSLVLLCSCTPPASHHHFVRRGFGAPSQGWWLDGHVGSVACYNKQLNFISRMNSNCKSEVFHPPTHHSGIIPRVRCI